MTIMVVLENLLAVPVSVEDMQLVITTPGTGGAGGAGGEEEKEAACLALEEEEFQKMCVGRFAERGGGGSGSVRGVRLVVFMVALVIVF